MVVPVGVGGEEFGQHGESARGSGDWAEQVYPSAPCIAQPRWRQSKTARPPFDTEVAITSLVSSVDDETTLGGWTQPVCWNMELN